MFEGFKRGEVESNGVALNVVYGGSGPAMLLLHGYPRTHACWHRVAPLLAEQFTVVCPDLRGYGDSTKPPGDPEHRTYARRTMARDQVAVMRALGFERFAVTGHDRGGRVARRLALDYPDRVTHLALLDIVPTATIYATLDQRRATDVWRYFFLIQPYDLPERLIGRAVSPLDPRALVQDARRPRRRGDCRVSSLLRRGHHPCDLRGLSRGRNRRPGRRRGGCRADAGVSTPAPLERARPGQPVRRAGLLA